MLWLALERVRPVDVTPAGNVLQCAEGRPITTGRDEQRLIDPHPAYVSASIWKASSSTTWRTRVCYVLKTTPGRWYAAGSVAGGTAWCPALSRVQPGGCQRGRSLQ